MGAQHRLHSVRSCEPALRAVGVAGGRPRGECLLRLQGASEVRRSSSPSCPPTGRAVGVRCPRAVGSGVRMWGPGTVLLAHVPCGELLAAGVAGGRPGGVTSHHCGGRLVSGAFPPLAASPSGRAARPPCPCVPGTVVWAWGPGSSPTACTLASQRCALWGWRGGRPQGGASCRCEGRLRSGVRPPPAARPRGGQPRSLVHVLRARLCGRGGPALSRGWRGIVLGGATSHSCEGRLVLGASPLPAAHPWGRAAKPRCPCFSGAAVMDVGTQHRPHRVRSCEPVACCGVGGRASLGGCPAPS